MPTFSIIIPLYNKAPHIARALDSVLCQSYQDFELIVVDDGSTDNGGVIVKGYNDSRLHYTWQENRGVSLARNRGAELAVGELLAFLDADDEWTPKHLETICGLWKTYPGAGIYTDTYKEYDSGDVTRWTRYNLLPRPPWKGIITNLFASSKMCGEFPVCSSTAVIPKHVFVEAGGYPRGCSYPEDVDLYGRIALEYPVAFSWEVGAIYHLDAENRICKNTPPPGFAEPFVKNAKDAMNRGEVIPELVDSLREYVYTRELDRVAKNVQAGNNRAARMILGANRVKGFYKKKFKWLVLSNMPHPLYLFLQEQIKRMKGRTINHTGQLSNAPMYLDISTYDGSGQLVHPDIEYTMKAWNGFNYILAFTPYPGGNDDYENPSIRGSVDGIHWAKFPGQPDPIVSAPLDVEDGGHYADPSIVLVGDTLYLFYLHGNGKYDGCYVNFTSTKDAVTWSPPVKTNLPPMLSPTFIRNAGVWQCWGRDYNKNIIIHYTSSDTVNWIVDGTCKIPYNNAWHLNVSKNNGIYEMLLTTIDAKGKHILYLIQSPDGITWKTHNKNHQLSPSTMGWDDKIIYESTLLKTGNTYRVWYSAMNSRSEWRIGYTEAAD